jgi:hypothetical protein
VTFQKNKSYFKKLENEINARAPSNILTFPSIEYPSEDEIMQEEENEHEVEDIPQMQEEENKALQIQEEGEEGIKEIPYESLNEYFKVQQGYNAL